MVLLSRNSAWRPRQCWHRRPSHRNSDISPRNVGHIEWRSTRASVPCALGFIRSVTMAADLDQFQQLLNTLLSTDNDVRTRAEVRVDTWWIFAAAPGGRRSRSGCRGAARGAVVARSCRARCRRVVRARTRVTQPASGARTRSVDRRRRRSARTCRPRGDPSCGDRALNFDVPARAIGQEIQNGVSHVASHIPRAARQLRQRRVSRVSRHSVRQRARLGRRKQPPSRVTRPSVPARPPRGTHVSRDASRFPAYTRARDFRRSVVTCTACIAASLPWPRDPSDREYLLACATSSPLGAIYIWLLPWLTARSRVERNSSNIHTCVDYNMYSARSESDL